jgi:hypothetical protein
MFNAESFAKEVFKILQTYDYQVDLYDEEGNKTAEPGEARRFFAFPKNITISIREDGENSKVTVSLSRSVDLGDVSGMLDTLRTLTIERNLLFSVNKSDEELKPKSLSPHLDEGVNSVSDVINEAPRPEDPDKGDKVVLRALIAAKTYGDGETGERSDAEPIQVNKSAWDAFCGDPPHLEVARAPDVIRASQMGASATKDDLRRIRLLQLAPFVVDNTMHNLLTYVAARFEEGDTSALLRKIADQAVKATYPADLMNECLEEGLGDEDDTDQQVNDTVDAAAEGDPKAAATYQRVTGDSTFTKNIQNGQAQGQQNGQPQNGQQPQTDTNGQPIKKSLAPKPTIKSESWDTEGLLIREGLDDFAKWFDSLSADKLFETEELEEYGLDAPQASTDNHARAASDKAQMLGYKRVRSHDAVTHTTDHYEHPEGRNMSIRSAGGRAEISGNDPMDVRHVQNHADTEAGLDECDIVPVEESHENGQLETHCKTCGGEYARPNINDECAQCVIDKDREARRVGGDAPLEEYTFTTRGGNGKAPGHRSYSGGSGTVSTKARAHAPKPKGHRQRSDATVYKSGEEQDEQLNELSNDTLTAYRDKANPQRQWAQGVLSTSAGQYADQQRDGGISKLSDKRARGLDNANGKIGGRAGTQIHSKEIRDKQRELARNGFLPDKVKGINEAFGDDPSAIDQHKERGELGYEEAIDVALTQLGDDFNVADFLNEYGADFGYLKDDDAASLDSADQEIDYKDVRSSLHHALERELDSIFGDELPSSVSEPVVDQKIDEVIEAVESAGYTVVGREVEGDDLDIDDGHPDDSEMLLDDEGDEDVLGSEDVLQPSNKVNDFAREVTVKGHDRNYVNRLTQLAGIKPQR